MRIFCQSLVQGLGRLGIVCSNGLGGTGYAAAEVTQQGVEVRAANAQGSGSGLDGLDTMHVVRIKNPLVHGVWLAGVGDVEGR